MRWQYRVDRGHSLDESWMNEMGRAGWELVQAVRIGVQWTTIWKRVDDE